MLAKLIANHAVLCSMQLFKIPRSRYPSHYCSWRRSREISYSNPPARCGADSHCTPCVRVASLAFCDRASRPHTPTLPQLVLVYQASRYKGTAEDKAEPTLCPGARSLVRAGQLPLSLLATDLCFVLLADLSAWPASVSQSHSPPLDK